LQDFPRIPLAVLSTPIQKLENISRLLNTNVYIKRDDLTGIGLSGNKVRKLEFLLADAKRKGAEVVFTTGGAQFNHAMLTAACAKKLGMEPILILKKRGVTERKGNQLLEYLMDTDVRFMDTDSYDDIYAEMDRVGKAFAGLVKMAREGQFKPTDNVLYLYSGGAGGLFAIDIELD
jgi:ACC deaminase/D-cysteine desulfhydrase family protein